MSHESQQQLAQQVHAGQRRLVLVLTGGGSGAIAGLLTVPGASRSVLAAHVPYAAAALAQWLGGPPEEACSARTARLMAMVAYREAKTLDSQALVLGVACSASLASNRPKRGPHRAHVAYQSETTTASFHLELNKGLRDRAGEEQLVAELILNAIAEAVDAAERLELSLVEGETVFEKRAVANAPLRALLEGHATLVPLRAASQQQRPLAIFPGAFHPLHEGHRQMAETASQILGTPVGYEISVQNVDKPPLDFIDIDERSQQFDADEALWLTRAPTFEQKADLFPGATFVVGADTIERVGQERYYDDSVARRDAAIAHLAARGCRFLVFGRESDGRFVGLDELKLPPALAQLCQGVPEQAFRADVSSTQLRAQARGSHDE